ncbi:hypothetical protein Tco_0180240, partial [Tanacetum coccineum]
MWGRRATPSSSMPHVRATYHGIEEHAVMQPSLTEGSQRHNFVPYLLILSHNLNLSGTPTGGIGAADSRR